MGARLLFGTAGIPHCAPKPTSVAGVATIRALGLDAMEVQFVQRVSMGDETASQVRRAARDAGVRLSVHAPYYINLNSKDPEKRSASRERLLKAASVGAACGARDVVFHAAFYHDDAPQSVYRRVRSQLQRILQQLRAEGLDICLRPETMGRSSQFGSLEEVLRLSAELDGVRPCIDFGHLHARSGAFNTYSEFASVLSQVRQALGRGALKSMHMHVAGIAYGHAGERKHLVLADSDLRYHELLQACADWGVRGTMICESPNLEDDALLLKRSFVTVRV
jgi:deoxyribonuclease-4